MGADRCDDNGHGRRCIRCILRWIFIIAYAVKVSNGDQPPGQFFYFARSHNMTF